MTDVDTVDGDDLRAWLEHVQRTETTRWLMIGIAADEGVSVEDLARWYDLSANEVTTRIEEAKSEPLVVLIADSEGVDFDAMAEASGLNRRTIVDWFRALDDQPIERAADIVRRYSQRSSQPLLSGTKSRVHYLNYDAIVEQGWSVDDANLFEKISDANLDSEDYGRFIVEPGETILEAAERSNISWPFACRGGACANCAVIVNEGDVAMPGQTILTNEQIQDTNARLTCVGVPVTRDVKLVMNVQHLDQLEDLRLPSPMS